MRRLRNYLDKIVLVLILMCLWILLCGVLIEKRVTRKNVKPQHQPAKPQLLKENSEIILPIILMACNKNFVARPIMSLVTFRRHPNTFPIFIIQDCISNDTYEIIRSSTFSHVNITVLVVPDPHPHLGRHYKFALNHVLRTLKHKAAIVIDDNLDISRDFYEYFLATYNLFEKDASIWCVTAWNDNCKNGLVETTELALLHRTEHFPGMGWMIQSKTWDEIVRVVPDVFFASFLNTVIPRGRVCIRPEISRTFNFGPYALAKERLLPDEKGERLLNTGFVPFTKYDLSYLLQQFEHVFVSFVYSSPETTVKNVMSGTWNSSLKFVRIPYSNVEMFMETAKTLGLTRNSGDFGIFPTALHGIVQCFIYGRRVFIAPTHHMIFYPTHHNNLSPSRSVTYLNYNKVPVK